MHAVLQLTHIARPGQRLAQVRHAAGAERTRRRAVLAHQALHEGLRQQQRVALAFTQRRQRHGQHVDAEQQVLAEQAARNLRLEVDVRGRNEAHVGLFDARAAQGTVAAVVHKTQQRGLRARAQRIHLVEKERATLGQADDTTAVALGVGVSAAHVAEELGLQQAVGQGTAIDGHEGPAAARAEVMQRTCRQLFAGAGFAAQQHRGFHGCALLQQRQGVAERDGAADEVQRAPVGFFLNVQR